MSPARSSVRRWRPGRAPRSSSTPGWARWRGATAVGVDWRLPLDEASEKLENRVPLQGNLDPALLSAPWSTLRAHIDDVIERGSSAPAHVLNLGHGVPPETDPDVLTRIVAYVHGDE